MGARHEVRHRASAETSHLSQAPCCTPSAFPSRKSLASSTCIPAGWRPSASLFPRGSTARCAPPIDICSTTFSTPIYGAISQAASCARWGAKSLQESGKRGEPFLAGDGYARIGESSGSTNVLTGSGVDEAWTTGVLLARRRHRALRAGKPFTPREPGAGVRARRRDSWLEREAHIAEKSRDGFQRGVVTGLIGMAVAGLQQRQALSGRPSCEPYGASAVVG